MTPHGYFHWNELMTRDVEKSKAFYSDTLGWTYTSFPMGNGPAYWVVMDGEKPIGGMVQMQGANFEGMPEHWMAYISVDDVDARVEKAVAAGATLMHPAFDVENVGRIALLQQPGGAVIGWMTPAN